MHCGCLLTPCRAPPCPPPLLARQVIAESQPGQGNEARPFYDFLESCLRHKSEIVIFEAARAICNMRCAERGQGGCALLGSKQCKAGSRQAA